MNADVAVVIATRNRPRKILATVESVLASDLKNIAVVVVDQSDDKSTELVLAPFCADTRFTYVRSALRGVSRGRNTGIAHTSAPLVAITDDDCLVPPDWVSSMTQPFHDDPRVGIVFGSVVPLEPGKPGSTPSVLFDKPRTLTSVNQVWWLGRKGLCLGASMAVRRSAFDELRGFDDQIGPGATITCGEENDLSWRSFRSGWRTHVTNTVEVVHDGHRDLDELRRLVVRDFFGVGGTLAKYLRTFHPGALWFLVVWLFEFGVRGPVQDLLRGQRPRGFRRPYSMLQGLHAGFRLPLDKKFLQYEPQEREWVPVDSRI